MKKNLFIFSGEGTSWEKSGNKLIKSSAIWPEAERILKTRMNIDLETWWTREIGNHHAPHSPLLTVLAQICLADIWKRWGYRPDAVVGHSIGELSAAYEAGFYSLEDILNLTYEIGTAAAKLEGAMLHGSLPEAHLAELAVNISSRNFHNGDGIHVTLSGQPEEMAGFLKSHPGFHEMRPPHPWHHREYEQFAQDLKTVPAGVPGNTLFVSGVTGRFEERLAEDHWKRWLFSPIDFIAAMASVKERFGTGDVDVIEIGFHPVLKHACGIFQSHAYASSMYRGEDEFRWILFQRRKLGQTGLHTQLKKVIDKFRSDLDWNVPLAYQDVSSLNIVELTVVLQPYFPGLEPQDFYRFKTLQQLIASFGGEPRAEAAAASQAARNEVAVAGMSCRFPSASENPLQFWRSLMSKTDQVGPDAERGDFDAGFLKSDVTRFDHRFFNIPEAEARTMDPQQILALELTELLWRDAGIDPAALDRTRVGVYLGVWNEEYRGDRKSVYYPTGTNPSIIASRISYHYDLRGPSWVGNTACASSLLAIHYACKDIEAGRVDYAVAGGVNMLLGNEFTGNMKNSGFMSKQGRCKAFDNSASGYVRAEGGGLVLLVNRTLVDKAYALVSGSCINQNGGRAQVITAPHPEAQEEVILGACREAGIEPGRIAYVECHGTGTKIGDPIEVSALQNTIARGRKDTCYIGSVKSNIGHLESAAGIAGFIKSLLVLNQGTIPPDLHFDHPNEYIDFDSFHIKVVSEPTSLDRESLIGISSFGFGGSNAHVILRGVEDAVRKPVVELSSPFDRGRSVPLSGYFSLGDTRPEAPAESAITPSDTRPKDAGSIIGQAFYEVTNIREIDPDVELIDQGLDSMGATQFVATLEQQLGIELDADLLFEYPLIGQLENYLDSRLTAAG